MNFSPRDDSGNDLFHVRQSGPRILALEHLVLIAAAVQRGGASGADRQIDVHRVSGEEDARDGASALANLSRPHEIRSVVVGSTYADDSDLTLVISGRGIRASIFPNRLSGTAAHRRAEDALSALDGVSPRVGGPRRPHLARLLWMVWLLSVFAAICIVAWALTRDAAAMMPIVTGPLVGLLAAMLYLRYGYRAERSDRRWLYPRTNLRWRFAEHRRFTLMLLGTALLALVGACIWSAALA